MRIAVVSQSNNGLRITLVFLLMTIGWSSSAQAWPSRLDTVQNYTGFLDGKPINVRLDHWRSKVGEVTIGMNLTYESTGDTVWNTFTVKNNAHEVRNLRLRTPNEGTAPKSLSFEYLHLHTWDERVLSGVVVSSGRRYGVVLREGGIESTEPTIHGAFEGGLRGRRECQLSGRWYGYLDGRSALLQTHAERVTVGSLDDGFYSVAVILTDIDRGVTYRGYGRHRPNINEWYVIRDIEISTSDGGTLKIPRLYIHTWNTNYIAGYTDGRSGLAFSRRRDSGPANRNNPHRTRFSRAACLTPRPGGGGVVGGGSIVGGSSCDSAEIGVSCTATPSACSIGDFNVLGTTVCRGGNVVCDISEAAGRDFCSSCGGGCGRCLGEPCTTSNQCVPGASCNARSGRCEPIPGGTCRVADGTCWLPSDLEDGGADLCRASDDSPEVPPDFTACRSEEEGSACTTTSRRCPGFDVPGRLECFATSRFCRPTSEGERACRDAR